MPVSQDPSLGFIADESMNQLHTKRVTGESAPPSFLYKLIAASSSLSARTNTAAIPAADAWSRTQFTSIIPIP
jgi:hypothetical protein